MGIYVSFENSNSDASYLRKAPLTGDVFGSSGKLFRLGFLKIRVNTEITHCGTVVLDTINTYRLAF